MTFTSIETKSLPDIQSEATMYRHQETGALVLRLANDDSNKAFTIGFRTPPYSDNGIAHILEHAVLNGSERFPSKEPFVELIKGSLNTFINAMTFSDKTIYPVASINQADFMNLMTVYLDAVFRPNMRQDAQILQQEGWHYHLESADDDLIYKGVVYNEMKGALGSAESQLFNHIGRTLYPGSIYAYESGGNPKHIPELTQEEFRDFHKRYYHPSNSLTILYGDLDQEAAFETLEEYFESYESQVDTVKLAFEPKLSEQAAIRETYSITEGESPEDKTYLALAWHLNGPNQALDTYGMRVLSEVLLGNNEAPLKKALLEAEVGGDIEGGTESVGYPEIFYLMAKYTDESKMKTFQEIVEATLSDLVENGIPKRLLQAALNKINFALREAAISQSNPRGVIYAIRALETWLYDESPYPSFEFSHYMQQLEDRLEGTYFEDLISRKLLNNDYRVEITLVPEPGKNDRLEAASHAKLQEYKASLSEEELDKMVETTQALIQRQSEGDRPEDLAKIPSLQREDLSTETEHYPLEVTEYEEFNHFYFAEQFTSGIDYVTLLFDISDIPAEDYADLSLLATMLTNLSTKQYSLADLRTEIDQHTGGIHAALSLYQDKSEEIHPYFALHGRALEANLTTLIELMKEVLVATQFEQREMQRVIQQSISGFEQKIAYRANGLASNRALSQIEPLLKLAEQTSGIDGFKHQKAILDSMKDSQDTDLAARLQRLLDVVLNRQRMSVLYIGEAKQTEAVQSAVREYMGDLKSEAVGEPQTYKAGVRQNEAFVTSQDVNYVGYAAKAQGPLTYGGPSMVLSMIARLDYLWNNVRVKGGAYGASYGHDRHDRIHLSSYRDPNIGKTLETYRGLGTYVSELSLESSDMLKYVIGTMSQLLQPLSASAKGEMAFRMYMTGMTTQDLIDLKESLLATTAEQVQAYGDDLQRSLQDGAIAVIGNKAQIDAESDLFDEIIELY